MQTPSELLVLMIKRSKYTDIHVFVDSLFSNMKLFDYNEFKITQSFKSDLKSELWILLNNNIECNTWKGFYNIEKKLIASVYIDHQKNYDENELINKFNNNQIIGDLIIVCQISNAYSYPYYNSDYIESKFSKNEDINYKINKLNDGTELTKEYLNICTGVKLKSIGKEIG
jgi:hypothetical protein